LLYLTNFSRSRKVGIMAKYFYSPAKQRTLLLLATGLTLGLSTSPRTHAKIWRALPKAWKAIGRRALRRIVNEFKYKRLVDFVEEKDGVVSVVLTELGERHAIRYNPEKICIHKSATWDKKWRIVVFDIPEKKKKARDALRWELKKLGFKELQRSVWVYPYECKDAVDFLVEFFEIRNYVRLLEVAKIFHDADLRLHFNLV